MNIVVMMDPKRWLSSRLDLLNRKRIKKSLSLLLICGLLPPLFLNIFIYLFLILVVSNLIIMPISASAD